MGNSADTQARIFTHYLVHKDPSDAHRQLFSAAIVRGPDAPIEKTLRLALKHPKLIPYLDAYDALSHPNSQLRQRLYLMFAILEASPDFTELFLPQKCPKVYAAYVALHGVRGIFRLGVGCIIITFGMS